MKKYSLLVSALLLTFGVYGQSIFERYTENDEVTLVSISPKMFKMLGQMSINLDSPQDLSRSSIAPSRFWKPVD